ncbi:hypothetical protein MYXO_03027 [Myxococcaceae bacterium]|jgi:flagellar biosynthesis protein FlhG|nr:hypothetical protein MYXO_03027 [Myxococcaceae bacterium]
MKPLSELDHYEVLEIERTASTEEVERAYQVARGTYAEGSLATYSVFGERDTEALRHRIEAAFRTLSDPDLRRRYDAELGGEAPLPPIADEEHDALLESLARRLAAQEEPALPERLPSTSRGGLPRDLLKADEADDDDPGSECDGARLRKARVRRGLEIDEIASITKINPTYLRAIEDELVDQLPAAVYVRGFVKAFARCVGLDPVASAQSYMGRFDAAPPARRGRIFGRQPQA